MSLLSLIAVLLLEQVRPLPYQSLVLKPLQAWADFLERRMNAGVRHGGAFAWGLGVLLPVLLAGLLALLLERINPLLSWLWTSFCLYLTMGFRQFSHYYTDILVALRMNDLDAARRLLADWRGESTESLSASEVARRSIVTALQASHRHVFAVLVWFVLLPGPCGAIFYRLAAVFSERWGQRNEPEYSEFGRFSRQAMMWIDALPARITAFGFAVVGNFEDAIYCWRLRVRAGGAAAADIVLASGGGALGVSLEPEPVARAHADDEMEALGGVLLDPAESCGGAQADVEFMSSAVGLVWRALVLWLLLLFLLGLASLVGS